MYTVYALYNQANKKIYIGQTEDLPKRLEMHQQSGFGENHYTARFRGTWELIYQESVETREQAIKREKQLKSYQGRQFIKKQIPVALRQLAEAEQAKEN